MSFLHFSMIKNFDELPLRLKNLFEKKLKSTFTVKAEARSI